MEEAREEEEEGWLHDVRRAPPSARTPPSPPRAPPPPRSEAGDVLLERQQQELRWENEEQARCIAQLRSQIAVAPPPRAQGWLGAAAAPPSEPAARAETDGWHGAAGSSTRVASPADGPLDGFNLALRIGWGRAVMFEVESGRTFAGQNDVRCLQLRSFLSLAFSRFFLLKWWEDV